MAAWPRDSGPVILGKLRTGAKVGSHQRKSRHYVTISSSQTAELRGKPGTGLPLLVPVAKTDQSWRQPSPNGHFNPDPMAHPTLSILPLNASPICQVAQEGLFFPALSSEQNFLSAPPGSLAKMHLTPHQSSTQPPNLWGEGQTLWGLSGLAPS